MDPTQSEPSHSLSLQNELQWESDEEMTSAFKASVGCAESLIRKSQTRGDLFKREAIYIYTLYSGYYTSKSSLQGSLSFMMITSL